MTFAAEVCRSSARLNASDVARSSIGDKSGMEKMGKIKQTADPKYFDSGVEKPRRAGAGLVV